MDAVRLEGVGVVRSGNVILDDVSVVIAPEDRWVVLGPNGAGKTTLLALMSTQLFPTSGEVMLLDEGELPKAADFSQRLNRLLLRMAGTAKA